MASIVAMLVDRAPPPPPLGEVLSGIFGSVSLTAWICLLLPQLITNYRAKSADALSMKFLVIWLLGDITNLSGALFTHLAPTTITIGCYFCIADLVLISQCVYYNTINARRRAAALDSSSSSQATAVAPDSDPAETEPLLAGRRDHHHHNRRHSETSGLPGSHRRHEIQHEVSGLEPLKRCLTGEDDTPDENPWMHNALSLLAVWVVGAAAWFLTTKMDGLGADDGDSGGSVGGGVPTGAPEDGGHQPASDPAAVVGMVLGYTSALCYLCARIPQIIKNWQEKSCEGLALLFFLLSLTGNSTYGASILSFSQDPQYLIKALPWLLGSLGTIVEDMIIFVQFRLYSPTRMAKAQDTA